MASQRFSFVFGLCLGMLSAHGLRMDRLQKHQKRYETGARDNMKLMLQMTERYALE